jgi:FlaA1/EpsC-like NDP-sugar epimerase
MGEQRVVGVRPGEKIDEEMITTSDSLSTVDLGKYYAILPARGSYTIDDYCQQRSAERVEPGFAYNSGTNSQFLNVADLRALIGRYIAGRSDAGRLK